MKRKLIISSVILFFVVVLFMIIYSSYLKRREAQKSPELIGGQKDIHGCLIAAGYSWCEDKQKCLRTWEEECADSNQPLVEDHTNYTNEKYGFELKFPDTWKGYQTFESSYDDYVSVAFSFRDPHQPFSIFSILIYNPQKWVTVQNKSAFRLLKETENNVFVCDGCCGIDDSYNGGGQFDEFQVERCSEGGEIMDTFNLINM